MSINEPFLEQEIRQNGNKELSHIKILLYKNFLNVKSAKKQIITQIVSPLVICLIIYLFSYVAENKVSHPTVDWSVQQQSIQLPRNNDFKYQFGYAIIGQDQEWTDYSLKYIKQLNQLQDQDVNLIYQQDTDIYHDFMNVTNYFKDNPSTVLIGALFCTSEKVNTIFGQEISCTKSLENFGDTKLQSYVLFLNYTEIAQSSSVLQDVQTELPKSKSAITYKLLIDNSLISFSKWKKLNPTKTFDKNTDNIISDQFINLEVQDFPTPAFRIFDSQDVVTSTGAFYFLIPLMLNFLSSTQEIVKEKDAQLRQYLNVIGVSHFAYWMSWLITCTFYNLISALSITIFGLMFQYRYFLDTPFLILVFLFFSLGFAFNSISFLLSIVCKDLKVSNTVTYAFLLLSFVLQLLLSNIILVYQLYGDNVPGWVVIVKYILTLYAPFNFAKAFGDISQFSGNHFDITQNKWVIGTGYTYEQFTKEIKSSQKNMSFSAPSTYTSISYMYLDALIFGVIAWYLDNIIIRELPFYFMFKKQYWFPEIVDQKLRSSQVEAKNNVIVQNVSKTYRKSLWDKNGHKALKGVSFQVEKGELLSILGHNGAGKSTLFSIMTGNIKASSGEVFISNYEINANKDQIRKLIGICPQFDIQWPELTAREHFEIFSAIKFVPNQYEQKLQEVDLESVANARVGTFSGGMKRRLSIAIAGIGNPDIIFLDEPTTGMDPKSRRKVWQLIQNLKKDKSIILTTHAMEEADVLSDRIMVVNKGELKCIGTSLNLKNNFGDGYKLSIISEPKFSKQLTKFIKNLIPTCKLLDSSGGSLIFTIPILSLKELQGFFHFLENSKDDTSMEIKQMIQDWNLSNTTLEEVFMKMTKHQENEEIQ